MARMCLEVGARFLFLEFYLHSKHSVFIYLFVCLFGGHGVKVPLSQYILPLTISLFYWCSEALAVFHACSLNCPFRSQCCNCHCLLLLWGSISAGKKNKQTVDHLILFSLMMKRVMDELRDIKRAVSCLRICLDWIFSIVSTATKKIMWERRILFNFITHSNKNVYLLQVFRYLIMGRVPFSYRNSILVGLH